MRAAVYVFLLVASAGAQEQSTSDLMKSAIAAHSRGDLASAAKSYRLVLQGRPDLIQARLNLGAALAELGDLDQAIAVLAGAPGTGRNSPEIRLNLALAYHRKDDLPAAIKELEQLPATRFRDVHTVSVLADCYLRSGAPDKAVALLQPAVKAHPENVELNYQAGMALVRNGHPEQALEPLERAGKTGNNADAWLLAGATALDMGQFQRAREDLEIALRLNPGLPGAFTWTGMARDRVSDEEGAKDAFRRALEVNPQDFEANLHLGAILYRERELESARPYLEHAAVLQPSSILALYALALVRSGTGDLENAVKDLERVSRTAPDWAEPHVKLASLYYKLNRDSDGDRERAVVEKLKSEKRAHTISFPALEDSGGR
jgi:tetratricopeptide (TPR) repeat protein